MMSEAALPPAVTKARLEYLPVAIFGSVMGLTGLSVAWRLARAFAGAIAMAIFAWFIFSRWLTDRQWGYQNLGCRICRA